MLDRFSLVSAVIELLLFLEFQRVNANNMASNRKGIICVAYGCSNTTSEGVKLHSFPWNKHPEVAKVWERNVSKTRANWKSTKWSRICSAHFEEECFTLSSRTRRKFDPTYPLVLEESAVPTLFDRPHSVKRQTDDSRHIEGMAKKMKSGGAFAKRERARTLQETEDPGPAPSDSGVSHAIKEDMTEVKSETFCNIFRESACQTDPKHGRRNKKISVHIYGKSKSVQVNLTDTPVQTRSVGVQCGLLVDQSMSTPSVPDSCDIFEEHVLICSSPNREVESDQSLYSPSPSPSSSCDTKTESDSETALLPPEQEEKYIVFSSALSQLFKWCHCPSCGCCEVRITKETVGTLLVVSLRCISCRHKNVWKSQPYLGKFAAGNILLSASILFSGAISSKVLRVFQHMRIACFSQRTYFRHQNNILQPVVQRVWAQEQTALLTLLQMSNQPLVLGGDGRADSPGYSAKFGCYTLMELEHNIIVDIQLVQSNECGGSYHMELTGLERALATVTDSGLEIGTLVTDRHRQISKWIRQNLPEVLHLYDIWHFAKGVDRKLQALAQQKGCHALKPWIHSIVNHIYWSAASTEPGNGELVSSKWQSVANHVQNIHSGHGEPFDNCGHGLLQGEDQKKNGYPNALMLQRDLNNLCWTQQGRRM